MKSVTHVSEHSVTHVTGLYNWKAMDGLKVSATGVRQAFTKRSLVRSRTPLGSAEWLAACGA